MYCHYLPVRATQRLGQLAQRNYLLASGNRASVKVTPDYQFYIRSSNLLKANCIVSAHKLDGRKDPILNKQWGEEPHSTQRLPLQKRIMCLSLQVNHNHYSHINLRITWLIITDYTCTVFNLNIILSTKWVAFKNLINVASYLCPGAYCTCTYRYVLVLHTRDRCWYTCMYM